VKNSHSVALVLIGCSVADEEKRLDEMERRRQEAVLAAELAIEARESQVGRSPCLRFRFIGTDTHFCAGGGEPRSSH
jgi:hypothetical protein